MGIASNWLTPRLRDATLPPVDGKLAVATAQPPPDAATTAPPAGDAARATRDVQVRLNVQVARIVVDGADATMTNGAATIALADGSHTIEVTSPGRVPLKTQVEVSATATTFAFEIERSKTKPKPTKDKPPTTDKPPKGDYTIDPF